MRYDPGQYEQERKRYSESKEFLAKNSNICSGKS